MKDSIISFLWRSVRAKGRKKSWPLNSYFYPKRCQCFPVPHSLMRSLLCSPVLEKLPQEKGISLPQCFLNFPYTHKVRSFYKTRKKHGSMYFSSRGQAYSKHKNKDQIHSGQKFKTQRFLKNRNRDFQFLVPHVRSWEVAILSIQVNK